MSTDKVVTGSVWDRIGAEFEAVSTARGGKHQLYKPVVRIEVYEHDDEVTVEVDRCKGSGGVVIRKGAMDGRTWQESLLAVLGEARAEAQAT